MKLHEIVDLGLLSKLITLLLAKGIDVFVELAISNLSGKDEKHTVKIKRVEVTNKQSHIAIFDDPKTGKELDFEILLDDDDNLELVKREDSYLLRYINRKKRITV